MDWEGIDSTSRDVIELREAAEELIVIVTLGERKSRAVEKCYLFNVPGFEESFVEGQTNNVVRRKSEGTMGNFADLPFKMPRLLAAAKQSSAIDLILPRRRPEA